MSIKAKIFTLLKGFPDVVLLTGAISSFYLILLNNPYTADFWFRRQSYLPHIVISATLAAGYVCYSMSKLSIRVTRIDLALATFIMSALLSRLKVVNNEPFFNDTLVNLLLAYGTYLIVRLISTRISLRFWAYLLLPALLLQVYLVLFGFLSHFGNGQSYMTLTGTLGNSGICAGFIVLTFPLAISVIGERRFIGCALFILLFLILTLLRSRGALLATIPALVSYLDGDSREALRKILSRRFVKISLVIIAVSLTTMLIMYKKDSVIGRMLIWRVSTCNMFTSPILGIGYGEFSETYRGWQTSYIKSVGSISPQVQLMDLPVVTFNEPLQIFLEQGVLGLVAFIVLVSAAWSVRSSSEFNDPRHRWIVVSLLSGLIFSVFSYPYHSMPILVISFILLARVGGPSLTRSWMKHIGLFVVPFLVFASLYFQNKRNLVNELKSVGNNSCDLLVRYKNSLPYLRSNGGFLLDYSKMLYESGQFDRAIEVLSAAERQSPKIEIDMMLGDIYRDTGKSHLAQREYLQSIEALPNRITARFKLFNLFIELKDTINAKKVGSLIISYPVKVQTVRSLNIKYLTEKEMAGLDKKISTVHQ